MRSFKSISTVAESFRSLTSSGIACSAAGFMSPIASAATARVSGSGLWRASINAAIACCPPMHPANKRTHCEPSTPGYGPNNSPSADPCPPPPWTHVDPHPDCGEPRSTPQPTLPRRYTPANERTQCGPSPPGRAPANSPPSGRPSAGLASSHTREPPGTERPRCRPQAPPPSLATPAVRGPPSSAVTSCIVSTCSQSCQSSTSGSSGIAPLTIRCLSRP